MYGLLLVAGCHTHQENYAREFARDPRCRLIGLTDEADIPARRRELNRQLADELQIPCLDDCEEALARPDVDLVSLCPEPERRERLTLAAIRAGRHVYLDKEPAATVSGAWQVAESVAAGNLRSQTFSLVRSPVGVRARDVLDSGDLGELVSLHAEVFFSKGIAGTADLSRPRQERAEVERLTFVDSKRELLCVGWYPLVFFQWLTGKRIVSVACSTGNYFFAEHQRNNVEDFALMLLELEGGLTATVTVGRYGWSSHPSHGEHRVQLLGTKSAANIDMYQPRLEISNDAAPWRPPEKPHPEDPMGFWSSTQAAGGVRAKTVWRPVSSTKGSDQSYFLDCLDAGRESDVNALIGARTVEAIFAGYRSAATGETVKISLR